MGFAQLLGPDYNEPLDLIYETRRGVKKSAVDQLQGMMGLSQKEVAELLHLTPRTLQRLGGHERLATVASGQLLEIARLFQMALDTLDDEEQAKKWFRTPIPALGHEMPLKLMDTPAGLRWISTILGRVEHGIYS